MHASTPPARRLSQGTRNGSVGRHCSFVAATNIAPGDVGLGPFGHRLGLNVEPPSLHGDDTTPLAEGIHRVRLAAVEHEGLNFVVEEEHEVTAGGGERSSARLGRCWSS